MGGCTYNISDRFKAKQENKEHTDRITGVVYDKQERFLFSCSKDKSLKVLDMVSGVLYATLTYESALTCMVYDSQLNQVFVGCATGDIMVCRFDPSLTGNERLADVHCLKKHTGPITCLHFDERDRLLFSGSEDNTVGIWQIEILPENAKRSRSVGGLRPESELKAVRSLFYNRERRQVCTGHSQGSIMIWEIGTDFSKEVLRLDGTHKFGVMSLHFVEESNGIMSSSEDGKVRAWQWPAGSE